jgi:hypothetical protein
MVNRFLFSVLLVLCFAGSALAGVDGPAIPSIEGKGVDAETNDTFGSGLSTIASPIFWVSDDSAVNSGTLLNDTVGVLIDTGDEACARIGMNCIETYTFAVGGGSGDEVVDSACSTDLADTTIALSFCN